MGTLRKFAAKHMLSKKAAVMLLALVCVWSGIRLLKFQSGGIGLGIFSSFLLLTGVQIFLWLFGIRIELFGTSAGESSATYRSRVHQYVDSDPRDFEKKKRLECEKEFLESELEVAELQSKIAELRSKVREEENRRRV